MDHPFQIPPSHTCSGGWRRRRWRMVADDVVAGCSSDEFTYNFNVTNTPLSRLMIDYCFSFLPVLS